jgi:deazaflavin-dependent oxidoreductase (nitroreductase family)
MHSDFTYKAVNAVHRAVVRLSGGRLGWTAAKLPVIELTTIGRRSGRRHSVMLSSPVQNGPVLVVVASRSGDDRHPAWFLNLCDHPEVEVSTKGRPSRPMLARVASPDERDRLWPQVKAAAVDYAKFEARTSREIPVVLLEPADAASPRHLD